MNIPSSRFCYEALLRVIILELSEKVLDPVKYSSLAHNLYQVTELGKIMQNKELTIEEYLSALYRVEQLTKKVIRPTLGGPLYADCLDKLPKKKLPEKSTDDL